VIDETKLPEGAVECAKAVTPGYYWWLPACAKGMEPIEWCIVDFHPLNGRKLSGWFVGPLVPPKPCALHPLVTRERRERAMRKLAREKAAEFGFKVSSRRCNSVVCNAETPMLHDPSRAQGWLYKCPNCGEWMA